MITREEFEAYKQQTKEEILALHEITRGLLRMLQESHEHVKRTSRECIDMVNEVHEREKQLVDVLANSVRSVFEEHFSVLQQNEPRCIN